ncbi:MAG: hypothetical protein ACOVT5_14165 [Armatimonadaceae bacterium]
MPDQPTDPAARIAELEAEVARLKQDRNLLKSIVEAKPPGADQLPELTEEEILDAMHGPRGKSLDEILAEHERRSGAA